MTPTQIEQFARQSYNAVNDTFWSQQEIFDYIYAASIEMAEKTKCIERTYTVNAVSGTQEYDFPANAMGIKRVTYNGFKLKPITMREDDQLTSFNQATTATGTPRYYYTWNRTIALRPIPGGADEIKLWAYNFPSAVTISSTLEIPEEYHTRLCNYVLKKMAAKDQNINLAQYYGDLWEKDLIYVLRAMKSQKTGDAPNYVQIEEANW